ncbi:MAG: glycosyltransferase family 4 protein [Fibrobacter sp.]|nr:glycosyltransferase family 4 protein [Fibrobacter sp.]
MKKILFITHDDFSSGSSRSLVAQIEFLKREKKIDPVVITWKENSLTAYLRKQQIPCFALKYDFTSVWTQNCFLHQLKRPYYRLIYNYTAYCKLKKEIDFSEISLIVSNSSVIDFGAYLHRKLQIPHVWYLREFGDLDFNVLPYVKDFPRYIESNSDGIVAVSKAVARHWQHRGIRKDIAVIYNGVSSNDVPLKEKNGLVKICMCGRLCPTKGQFLAVEAMAKLPNSVLKNIRLDFYGVGESEAKLKNLVKEYKLEKYIAFKGFSSSLDKELMDYDVGLTLSKAEAFGRTTVEYMNHALFVIGSHSGGTPELLQDGAFGNLVAPNSPEAVASAIEEYYKNQIECKKKAVCAQIYAKETFSVKTNAEKAFRFYEKFAR